MLGQLSFSSVAIVHVRFEVNLPVKSVYSCDNWVFLAHASVPSMGSVNFIYACPGSYCEHMVNSGGADVSQHLGMGLERGCSRT